MRAQSQARREAVAPSLAPPRARLHTAVLDTATVAVGRAARFVTRLRGGGTAFPGLVVERLNPSFIARSLAPLPLGVAVISGTNGKTTTTRLTVELLRGQGLRVFTNPSGSNFSRGVASALLAHVDRRGRIEADVAVLELDEAHGARFVADVPPRHTLLLNVFRDQLDRFGEIDSTARMLRTIARRTTGSIVLNRDDPRVAAIASEVSDASVGYFGMGAPLLEQFPGDDDLHGRREPSPGPVPTADVLLVAAEERRATLEIAGRSRTVDLRLSGSYNLLNATAAVAFVRSILGDAVDEEALLRTLAEVTPAFGRGEIVDLGGTTVELILVKNPAGFRLALRSFDPTERATVIAINDHDNDSRDVSWLWDVDFGRLRSEGVAMVAGTRAAEMALRLRYDEVEVGRIEPDLRRALDQVLASATQKPVRVYCTYTAMLQLRRHIASLTPLAGID